MKKQKVLVTGSDGFIGKALVEKLKELQFKVYTFSSRKYDIRKPLRLAKFPKFDYVYHLAGKTYAPNSWENPREFFEVNIMGTINMLEYLRKFKKKPTLIFAGSYVYGQVSKVPIKETFPTKAVNPYMESKLDAESVCKFYSENFGIPVISLRCFNIYGPSQKENFLIPSIIKGLKLKKLILNDSKPKRDLVFIDDVVDAYIKAQKHKKGFEVINIASGKSYSVKEIAEKLQQFSNTNTKIVFRNFVRPNEIGDTRADISKAKKVLGWKPKIHLDEGLKRVLSLS